MDKKKVLIIDDEAILRKTLEQALSQDFAVSLAVDGEEGIQKAKEVEPDLILLDIIMPNLDGIQTLKRLKAAPETKDISVVVLTNVEKSESVAEAVSLGAKGYMVKGDYSTDEIVENVKRFA